MNMWANSNISDMAHNTISFELAQKLIDIQLERFKLCVETVQGFLGKKEGKKWRVCFNYEEEVTFV